MANKLTEIVQSVISKRRKVFGRYMMTPVEIADIVSKVLKIMGTLSTDACQKCIAEVVDDVTEEPTPGA